jgi:hypothetical protein
MASNKFVLDKWNPKAKSLPAFFRDSTIAMDLASIPVAKRAAHMYMALADEDKEAVHALMEKELPPVTMEFPTVDQLRAWLEASPAGRPPSFTDLLMALEKVSCDGRHVDACNDKFLDQVTLADNDQATAAKRGCGNVNSKARRDKTTAPNNEGVKGPCQHWNRNCPSLRKGQTPQLPLPVTLLAGTVAPIAGGAAGSSRPYTAAYLQHLASLPPSTAPSIAPVTQLVYPQLPQFNAADYLDLPDGPDPVLESLHYLQHTYAANAGIT